MGSKEITMGKSQRIKGRAFEQKIARVLQTVWPKAKRGLQSQGAYVASIPDIVGTEYHIECSKGGESIWAKWKQAQHDSSSAPIGEQLDPIVIKQRDRELPVVLLSLKSFIKLLDGVSGGATLESQHRILSNYRKEFE